MIKIFSYLLLILFIISCTEQNIDGCTDEDACNYNPNAVNDNSSCYYEDENFDCDGNCMFEIDCMGICNGDALIDDCGVCNGDNSSCLDCMNIINGDSELDDCGVCNGDNQDIDECGVCFGEGPKQTSDWVVQIIARTRPWGVLDWISDKSNYFGVSNITIDGYDSGDIPDPPTFGTNWIKLFFNHPDWDSMFGENFTSDMRSNLFCDSKEWNMEIESNSYGPLELEFIFNNNVEQEVFNSLVIEIINQDESNIVSNGSIFQYNLEENISQFFLIKVDVN